MKEKCINSDLKTNKIFLYEKYMLFIGILGQLLFYMQGIKIFQTQSADDVSFFGFLIGLISVSSWLFYGILIRNKVLILSNVFAVGGALLVLLGMLIYKN